MAAQLLDCGLPFDAGRMDGRQVEQTVEIGVEFDKIDLERSVGEPRDAACAIRRKTPCLSDDRSDDRFD